MLLHPSYLYEGGIAFVDFGHALGCGTMKQFPLLYKLFQLNWAKAIQPNESFLLGHGKALFLSPVPYRLPVF